MQDSILHPTKVSFKTEGEIKTFHRKQILRPAWQEMLKEVLWRESKLCRSETQTYIKKEH